MSVTIQAANSDNEIFDILSRSRGKDMFCTRASNQGYPYGGLSPALSVHWALCNEHWNELQTVRVVGLVSSSPFRQ